MVVSIRDVAETVGVSIGTVSNVLNRPDQVNAELVARVLEGIRVLGYVRNDAARQLRAGLSRTIGMIVQDSSNPFFADMGRGAEDQAELTDRMLIVGNSHQSLERELRYIDLFQEQRVQGVFLAPIGDLTDRLKQLRNHNIAPVLVQRRVSLDDFCSVAGDDEHGGYLAVNHLLSIGRTRIAFVGGPVSILGIEDRLNGARRAVDEYPDARLEVIDTDELTVAAGREAGQQILAREVGARPDAMFSANDLVGLGLIQAFVMSHRIQIPDEIALIGYDDIAFASAAVVPLSTIRQPGARFGVTGVSLIQEEVDSPSSHVHRQVMFEPELVVRESTVGFGEEGAILGRME
jgi:LacI family transcriptional regulator